MKKDKAKFIGQDVSLIISRMRRAAIDTEIEKFASKWFLDFDLVDYEATHFKDGIISNETKLKDNADYTAYKEATENPLPKFKFNTLLIKDFKETLMPAIQPLL
ncbi:MAG: type I restriction endonuclease subunit R, partial [Butyrivibrio sp.]|nr:type I restriction endonuclease subunit R [Butyrivibrio sp.]